MPIGTVIPALNEAGVLPRLLNTLRPVSTLEIVVADGGSTDGTAAVAERLGAKVIQCPPGRGAQLNAGARAVTGDILFFIHADVMPPPGFEKAIPEILGVPGVAAGAFRLSIGAPELAFRMIERAANARSRLFGLPYGDQGFFLKRSTFDRMGGFADIPLMEDVDMVRRCRQAGKVVTADESMTVSARRWRKEGWLATTLRNSALLGLFLAGVPARRLAFFYPSHG